MAARLDSLADPYLRARAADVREGNDDDREDEDPPPT